MIEKPVYGIGNPNNDYGLGFYCTESIELAKGGACSNETDGYANQYELNLEGLSVLSLTGGQYSILNWRKQCLQQQMSFLKGRRLHITKIRGVSIGPAGFLHIISG